MKRASALAMLVSSGVVAASCNAVFGVTEGELDPNACVDDAGCDDHNPCTLDTCRDRSCIVLPVPFLQIPEEDQVAGDCKEVRCGAEGQTEEIYDDEDVPADEGECVVESCASGVPITTAVDVGEACSAGHCDGEGACVECLSTNECPDSNNCVTWACEIGVCTPHYEPAGTAMPGDVAGDCKKDVCDGKGATETIADPADPLVDGNDCTLDQCDGTTPNNTLFAADQTPCGMGSTTHCEAGICTGCVTPADCGTDTFCRAFACEADQDCSSAPQNVGASLPEAQQVTGDCLLRQCGLTGDVDDVFDEDPTPDSAECTYDTCVMGTNTHDPKPLNTACTQGGDYCDSTGHCVECNNTGQCPPTGSECSSVACSANQCDVTNAMAGSLAPAQMSGDCKKRVCDGMGAVAIQTDTMDPLNDGNQCTSDTCSGSTPVNPAVAIHTPCSTGFCNGAPKQCVRCTQDSQCTYCCDESLWMCGETGGSSGSGYCGVMSSGS
jgi:hypothetical protein